MTTHRHVTLISMRKLSPVLQKAFRAALATLAIFGLVVTSTPAQALDLGPSSMYLVRVTPEAKVAIENYAFGARGAQNDLGELHGCVKMQLHLSLSLYPQMVSPSSYRKVLLGKGNATKQQSYEYAQKVLTDAGLVVRNNDEADAYLVADWLRRVSLEEVE